MPWPKKRGVLDPQQPDFHSRRKAMLKRRVRARMRQEKAVDFLGGSTDGGEVLDVMDMIFTDE